MSKTTHEIPAAGRRGTCSGKQNLLVNTEYCGDENSEAEPVLWPSDLKHATNLALGECYTTFSASIPSNHAFNTNPK